jgi:hypothetical protein
MAARIACFVIGLLIVAVGTASADDKRILDVLLKKGIINRSEYEEILKEAREADVPVKGPVARETSKEETQVVSTEETQMDGKKPPVGSYKDLEQVPGGIEHIRKAGYRNVFTTLDSVLKHNERVSLGIVALKAQYNADNTDRKPSSSTADTSSTQGTLRDESGFRVRSAEIYVTGRLAPWATYYGEMDFARQNEIVLSSLYLDFHSKDMPYLKGLYPYISKLRIGQIREPFGIEQGTSGGLHDFVSRAYYTDLSIGANGSGNQAARAGDPGLNPFGKNNSTGFMQQMDVGMELVGKAPALPWKPELQVAVLNGAGRNFNDNNADKDFTGRLILTPTDGMKLYLAGYTGTSFFTAPNAGSSVLPVNTDVRKTRQGVMYTYIPPFLDDLVKLQAEYIEGQDAGFRRRTFYQYVLFRPFSWLPEFEPAYRYEFFTVDTNRPDSTLSRHTIGFNYYFHTNVKFTLNYEIRQDENEGSPFITTGGGVANANHQNLLTTQIQFRY